MYENKLLLRTFLVLNFICFLRQISSTSITFSYHTCLPNIDLIHIRTQLENFRLQTKDFRLYLTYTCENQTINYQFGNGNFSLPYSSSFDYQFQKAIDYYQEIDTWHYVNITFNDYLSKVFISFNGDETRLIPLIDYRTKNLTNNIHVDVLVDEQQTNVTCLLAHSGFQTYINNCSINIKTCEYRICTSSNPSEQYCPLFKIFDCRPFTDLECGLKTIPVRCLHNHCQNRGVCYVDLLRNLTQCVCPSGFAGNQCQYSIDECQSSPCPKHSHCIDLPNSYTCVCDPGWTGKDCSIDIDECRTIQPCKAAKSCINLPGSYKCDCFESFGGQNCEMTLDPCLSQPCLNNADQCHPILESDNVVFHCTCQLGFTGRHCETNINDCEGIICPKNNTFCVDGINSFDCQCRENFVKNSEGFCVEQNACYSSPCQSNGTCYHFNGGQYRCVCPPTFTGNRCENDIDECQIFPSICRNNGTCVNEHGSYRCYCSNGWTGSNCEKTIDYCSSQPCLRNGTCRNKVEEFVDGFECQCLPSFVGNVCQEDADECLTNPCLNNGTCENYLGGFHCRCSKGYFGNRCEHSPLECQTSIKCPNSHLCIVNDTTKLQDIHQLPTNTCRTERETILDQYFQCINQRSIDNCDCPRHILPCTNSIRSCPCRNGGTCFWLNSTDYRCYCPLNYTGKDCLTYLNPCSSQPCYHNGLCLIQNQTFTCQCSNSSRGEFCQELIDSCLNTNTTNEHCQSIIRTPCLSQPCQNQGKCSEINQTFECQCLFNTRGKFCEEKFDLCQTNSNTSLCLNGGTCQINNQTIQCHCLPGFTGLFCEENINECYTKPCSPHGNCIDLINGYQCQCHADWYGYNCDREQNYMSKSLILRSSQSSIFQLYESNINISNILSNRYTFLPIRIQYEFRTTIQSTSLLAIGERFQQEWLTNRIVTNLDKKIVLSTFIDNPNQWTMVIVEIYPLWIDVRIGKNSMSQRFYISAPTLEYQLEKEIIFGYRNYTGCVRQIEISYSQAYSILLTDQFVQLNSNRTLGCERTNACEKAICQKNELCIDHWFYHTCECQSPFYGHQCDQIAPIVLFNQSSMIDMKFSDPIMNLSFIFNTIQSNGILFELFSRKTTTNQEKLLGNLIHGRFSLIIIDNQPKYQEYEIRTKRQLNDGLPHEIQLNFNKNQFILDRIYNQSINKIQPNEFQFNSNRTLDGWIQDLRINNRMISTDDFKYTKQLLINPCYPKNPCRNHGICLVTNTYNYRCQCENNWFGENCTQINLCQSNLCPDGFSCQTLNNNYQECLAIGTFESNSSLLVIKFNIEKILINEFSFRLRANQQIEHLVTMRNLNTSKSFSLFLSNEHFLYREIDDLLISLDNQTYNQWTTYHFQWFNDSTLIFNNRTFYSLNSTVDDLFLPNTQIEIRLGNGFRGCLEYFLLGSSLYIPFYNQTRSFELIEFDNIQINNCTFENSCQNLSCQHGQCFQEFDQAKCLCNHGWQGEFCENNIDECQQGNNCSKEHSQCLDHLDGYYTCQCQQGFTGKYCEINIDECASNPCAHGGLCIDLINNYICNCTNNYISSNCSISLDATCFGRKRTCQNNGTCLLKSTNLYVDNPQTECQCLNGYYGLLCEYDACSKLDCQHDGTCQRLPGGQAKCLCSKEWYGNECEYDVNECLINQTNICLNNGSCLNLPGSYSCQCQEYYLGQFCERKHRCLVASPCLNHGICRPDDENYYCECSTNFTGLHCEYSTCESLPCRNNGTCLPSSTNGFSCNCTNTGYEGERCELEINECLSNPCLNNASCIDEINGFICSCSKSFTGQHCENRKFLAVLGFSYQYIIWPGVAVVLLIIIIFLSILISRIRESRRSRGTYRPALNENGQSSRVEFSMILKPPPEERLI